MNTRLVVVVCGLGLSLGALADGPPGPPEPSPDTCVAQGGVLGANLFSNGTFGTGSGAAGETAPPPGLGAQTTYLYSDWATGHPTNGEYTIVNYTDNVRPFGTWHGELYGHTTGQADDRFAVFDASIDAGTFYTQTLTVAPNTDFELSFWIMNINNNPADLLLPNVALVVRRIGVDPPGGGTVLATSGDIPEQIPTPSWHQFAARYNSGSSTSIEVRLDNNSSGGFGNDLALDDLVFAPCTTGTPPPPTSQTPVPVNGTGLLALLSGLLLIVAGVAASRRRAS